jgi:prepilin-type N-terminal cleavage/methylation domain-containing protein
MSIHRPGSSGPSGFTLIELLTVIAIISVLAGILIPVAVGVRSQAQRMDSIANLRSMGMAVSLYANDNKGTLPGPLQHIQYAVKTSDTTQLSYWLVEQMGFPTMKDKTTVPVLGHRRFFAEYGKDLSNYTAYIVNQKVYMGGVDSQAPWGYSGASGDKGIPKKLNAIDRPARAIAMMEVDQELLTDTNQKASTKSPPKPLFDDGRAVLYFDWHVHVAPFTERLGNNE